MIYPNTVITITFNDLSLKVCKPVDEEIKDAFLKNKSGSGNFPYWAKIWPAAQALSQFIISNHQFVAGKRVMEIAAGLGLPSMVAARFAKEILITEAAPEAIDFINSSIELNALKNTNAKKHNWNEQIDTDACEVMLMSDVNYNPDAFPELISFVKAVLNKGIIILLSTPQRIMAKPFIEALSQYIILQDEIFIEDEKVLCSVFVLSI